MAIIFPASYQESREIFISSIRTIQKKFDRVDVMKKAIPGGDDLTINWLHAMPNVSNKRVLIITTGLHGVEGFVGSAMTQLFLEEFLDRFDSDNAGLVIVHAINPWGMENNRRVNENNVDLNRNFMESEIDFKQEFNPSYHSVDSLLNPDRPLKPFWMEDPGFIGKVLLNIIRHGVKNLRGAVMLGQQSYPQGLYFSGREYQLETRTMMNMIEECFTRYSKVLHLDIHTGYGPRYQMSLVISPNEYRTSNQLEEIFRYPRVVQADSEEFYSMKGDMVDWVYRIKKNSYSEVDFFGTGLEFGVYGDGILKEIKSIRTMIFENQAYWKGTCLKGTKSNIMGEFHQMYHPKEGKWMEKALADCRQAISGILIEGDFLKD
jgi:hypothetical protein